MPVVIETHEENGVEWGVSLTSANPEPADYLAMPDSETAYRVADALEDFDIARTFALFFRPQKVHCENWGRQPDGTVGSCRDCGPCRIDNYL